MGVAFFVGVAVAVGVGADVLTDAEGDGVGVVEGTGAGQLSWPLEFQLGPARFVDYSDASSGT